MSAVHTSGPWQFYADSPSTEPNWHIVTNATRLRVIATVHIEPGNEADLANARLITAAPEMLSMLQVTRGNVASLGPAGALSGVPVYAEYRVWLELLDELIAKATGDALAQPSQPEGSK